MAGGNEVKNIFTTYEASRIFDVDITTIINWIDEGKLAAYKTPGGHRRILLDDLIEFAARYNLPMKEELLKLKKSASADDSPMKILIVEDDISVMRFIRDVVRRNFPSAIVETASDGFAAGEKLATFEPEILILDIRLPGVDGFEILSRIKKRPGKIKKILAITAFPSEETRKKIIRRGADDFLAKPFSIETLKQKLLALTQEI